MRRRARGYTILGYHDVLLEPREPHHLSLRAFERQMEVLAAGPFQVVPLQAAARDRESAGGRRVVVITIDDARDNFLVHVLPVLERLALPATLFAPSRLLGRPGHLHAEQLAAAAERGIEIGCHSQSHVDLTGCTPEALEREVRQSRLELEALLGTPVTSFSYPYGAWNPRVREAVARAGYHLAVTGEPGRNDASADPLLLHRSWPDSSMTPAWFEVMALGGDDVFRQPALRWLVRQVRRRAGGQAL